MIMVGATTPAGIADERARMVMVHFIKKHRSLQCGCEKVTLDGETLLVPCRKNKKPSSLHEKPGDFDSVRTASILGSHRGP